MQCNKKEGGGSEVGMTPPPKVTMILTVVSAFKSVRQCSVDHHLGE